MPFIFSAKVLGAALLCMTLAPPVSAQSGLGALPSAGLVTMVPPMLGFAVVLLVLVLAEQAYRYVHVRIDRRMACHVTARLRVGYFSVPVEVEVVSRSGCWLRLHDRADSNQIRFRAETSEVEILTRDIAVPCRVIHASPFRIGLSFETALSPAELDVILKASTCTPRYVRKDRIHIDRVQTGKSARSPKRAILANRDQLS